MASERSPIIFADAGQPTEDLESVLDREREKHKKRFVVNLVYGVHTCILICFAILAVC